MNPNAYQYNGTVNFGPGQVPEKGSSVGGPMTGGGMPANKNTLQNFQAQYYQQQQQQQQQFLAQQQQQQTPNQMFQIPNANQSIPSSVQNIDPIYPSQLPYNANPAMFVKNQGDMAKIQAYTSSMPPTNPIMAIPSLIPASSSPAQMTAQQQQQLLMQRAVDLQNHQQLDKSRVALLLDINVELLKETVIIQGKSTGATDGTNEVIRDPANEKVYQECMRRLQANLAYLAAIADRSHRPTPLPPSPAILVAPLELPNLIEPYKRLQSLFPGVKTPNSSSLQTGQIANGSSIAAHSRNLSQNVNVQQIMAGSGVGPPPELSSNAIISPQIGTGSKAVTSMLPISPSEQQGSMAQHPSYHAMQSLGGQQSMLSHEEAVQPSQTISPQLSLRQQPSSQLGLGDGLDSLSRSQQHHQGQNMMQHMQRMQQASIHSHQPQGQIMGQNSGMPLQSTQGMPHQAMLTQPNMQYMQNQQQISRQQQMMNPAGATYPQNFYTSQ